MNQSDTSPATTDLPVRKPGESHKEYGVETLVIDDKSQEDVEEYLSEQLEESTDSSHE